MALKGEPDRAIADFDQAASLNAQYAPAFNNRAIAYAAKSQTRPRHRRTTTRRSSSTAAMPSRFIIAATPNTTKATTRAPSPTTTARSSSIRPTRWCYNNRGNAYANKHDFDRAIADLSQAIRLNPGYGHAL